MTRTARTLLFFLALGVLGSLIALATGSAPPAYGEEEANPYLGVVKCRMCHRDQHSTWEEDAHSRAIESLSTEDRAGRKDERGRECISCHVTGFGQKGGFVSMEKTPDMANVGCEACHGPGRQHVTLVLKSVMDEEGNMEEIAKQARAAIDRAGKCSTCHNPHVSYKKLYGGK